MDSSLKERDPPNAQPDIRDSETREDTVTETDVGEGAAGL